MDPRLDPTDMILFEDHAPDEVLEITRTLFGRIHGNLDSAVRDDYGIVTIALAETELRVLRYALNRMIETLHRKEGS